MYVPEMRYPVMPHEIWMLPVGEVLSAGENPEHFGLHLGQGIVSSASKVQGKVVEEWPLDFSSGAQIIAHGVWSNRPAQEVVRTARSQLGEPYRLFNNNCEHFVRYCHGLERKSPQLQRVIGVGLTLAAVYVLANALKASSGARPTIRWI